jgi:hypothetical protein
VLAGCDIVALQALPGGALALLETGALLAFGDPQGVPPEGKDATPQAPGPAQELPDMDAVAAALQDLLLP